jgi:hypothetical protein
MDIEVLRRPNRIGGGFGQGELVLGGQFGEHGGVRK